MAGQLNTSYMPNYFSIEDILATQKRVPCTSTTNLPGLGFLDQGTDNPDLPPGTKLELPYWTVDGMKSRNKKYFAPQLPNCYKRTYREILLADPNVVDLHKLGPHYYEFGRHLMKHLPEEGELVGESISKAFKSRFLNLLDASQNCEDSDILKERSKMDELERELFNKSYRKRRAMQAWMKRDVYKISTSTMVSNYKKRKAVFIN